MWAVIKYKKDNKEIMKNEFKKKLGEDIEFYSPKFKKEIYIKNRLKSINVDLLCNYIFLRHKSFNDIKIFDYLKNIKGLNYFLKGHEINQNQINSFISFCKSNEDKEGYLEQSFFNRLFSHEKNGKFLTGPFTGMFFEIIEKKRSNVRACLNKFNITIKKNSKNLLYSFI